MYKVERLPAPLPTYRLKDLAAGSEAEVVPGRGGMAARFRVGDFPVLAMDDTTLYDEAKNVRGGMPILFPVAGRLAGDRYDRPGKTAACLMKQHGFARNMVWDVVSEGTDGAARLTVVLSSSEATRSQFPFDFRLEFTYELAGPTLRLLQSYENRSPQPMPLHAGFHPYFYVPDAEKAETVIQTRATRAFNNVAKTTIPFTEFDLTQKEVDLHLIDHGGSESVLTRPGRGGRIEIVASPEFGHWVVWTLGGKDFVCVEPWTAPGNALNTGDRLIWLSPGETKRLTLAITASS